MKKAIVASRGRNPNNPSDRTAGIPTEQRLEINKAGVTNTLTSVQKDNLALEIVDTVRIRQATKKGYIEMEVGGGYLMHLILTVKQEGAECRKAAQFALQSQQTAWRYTESR